LNLLLIKIFLLFTLLLVIYQDFKNLEVSWWVFPVLYCFGIMLGLDQLSNLQYLIYIIFNFGFIILQFIILTIYFSIKYKRVINLFKSQIGIGDILFFVFLSLVFEPISFIVFMIASILISLLVYLFLLHKHLFIKKLIPLAGLQSMSFFLLVLNDLLFNKPFYSLFTSIK
jgi:hypothetical protein